MRKFNADDLRAAAKVVRSATIEQAREWAYSWDG